MLESFFNISYAFTSQCIVLYYSLVTYTVTCIGWRQVSYRMLGSVVEGFFSRKNGLCKANIGGSLLDGHSKNLFAERQLRRSLWRGKVKCT
jgi:hypothetical protein